MAFLTDEAYPASSWWQQIAVALDPFIETVRQSSLGLTQGEIEEKLEIIHRAYSTAHRVNMPTAIQAQLIAAICNIQMSYCARYEGQTRQSIKHHRIAQVEWVLFQDMLFHEGIRFNNVQ